MNQCKGSNLYLRSEILKAIKMTIAFIGEWDFITRQYILSVCVCYFKESSFFVLIRKIKHEFVDVNFGKRGNCYLISF